MRKLLFVFTAALSAQRVPPNLLPGRLPPEIYAWFWSEGQEFTPGGYRQFIDRVADHSNFNLLTTSLRAPAREITLSDTHEQVKRAVEYAHSRGIRIVFAGCRCEIRCGLPATGRSHDRRRPV